MKVSICTGSKCSYYGANHIIDCMMGLKEELHDFYGVPEGKELEVELLPCQNYCKSGNHGVAPVVYLDGELIERAEANELMDLILERLGREEK